MMAAFVSLVIVASVSTGCGRPQDPKGYSEGVTSGVGLNFVTGCTASFVPQGKKVDPQAARHKEFCGCLYKALSNKKTGIPFDTFKSAQAQIREDPYSKSNTPSKLIPGFRKYVAGCPGGPSAMSAP